MPPEAAAAPFVIIALIVAFFLSVLLILAPYYIYVCAQELIKLRKLGQKLLEELSRR